jgi:hypothetical protein
LFNRNRPPADPMPIRVSEIYCDHQVAFDFPARVLPMRRALSIVGEPERAHSYVAKHKRLGCIDLMAFLLYPIRHHRLERGATEYATPREYVCQ